MHMRRFAGWVAAVVWSPALWALEGTVLVTTGGYFQPGSLIKIDCASGKRTTLVADGVFGPSFSPDGTKVAYTRNGKIYTINADGGNTREITAGKNFINWIGDNYLYWSEGTENIFRVDIATRRKEIVHTTSKGDIRNVSVSQDGKRAAYLKCCYSVWVATLGGQERNFGSGCRGTISPDGALVTHNLGNHRECIIHRFTDGSEYTRITIASGRSEFNQHRWSHSEKWYVLYTADNSYAYVCDVRTNTSYYVGRGMAVDYFRALAAPAISLSSSSLVFSATENGKRPDAQTISVTNAGTGTLGAVAVQESSGWLAVSRSGSGNAQTIANTVDTSGLKAGEYIATVTVTANGAAGAAKYTVTLKVSAQPIAAPTNLTATAVSESQILLAWSDGSDNETGFRVERAAGAPGGGSWAQVATVGVGVTSYQDTGLVADATFRYRIRAYGPAGISAYSNEVSASTPVGQAQAPSIAILSPKGNEVWAAGTTQSIRWTAENLQDVTIRYSTDKGSSWKLIAASVGEGDAQWGDYAWRVPDEPSTECLIYITGYDGGAPTTSGQFEIASGAPDTTAPAIVARRLGIGGALDDSSVSTVTVAGTDFPASAVAFGGEAAIAAPLTIVAVRALDPSGNLTVRQIKVSVP